MNNVSFPKKTSQVYETRGDQERKNEMDTKRKEKKRKKPAIRIRVSQTEKSGEKQAQPGR